MSELPLHELPLRLLRSVHRAALGCESKMRDRKKLARKLANLATDDGPNRDKVRAALVKAANAETDAKIDPGVLAAVNELSAWRDLQPAMDKAIDRALSDTGSPDPQQDGAVKNISAGSTATRIQSAVSQLPEDRARKLLGDVGGAFLAEEALKQEKKAARAEIADRIKEHWADMAEATHDAKGNPDPVASLMQARLALDAIEADETELKEVSKEFAADIKEEREKVRRILEDINQFSLPGIG